MCGIAGIIYRDGTHDVGVEMTRMLQSMKHRGPDSTGYALYGAAADGGYVMRYKLADANDHARSPVNTPATPAIHGFDGSLMITSYFAAVALRKDFASSTTRRTRGSAWMWAFQLLK